MSANNEPVYLRMGKFHELEICDSTAEGAIQYLPASIVNARKRSVKGGCGRELAAGQYWTFCGETDMGQTLPALCIDCNGSFKLNTTG